LGSDLQKILNLSIDTTSPIVTTLCRNELVCEVLYKDFSFYLDLSKKTKLATIGILWSVWVNFLRSFPMKKLVKPNFQGIMFVRFSTEIPHFILIPTNIWTPWTFFSSDLLKMF